MAATGTAQLSTTDVARSQAELNRMKRSLAKWLKYRAMVDQVAQGVLPTSKPVAYAAQIATNAQSKRNEQQLANQIHILLEQVNPDATLPNPDISANPDAAVQLAKMVLGIADPSTVSTTTPTATGLWGMAPWMLPVIIASALLIGITTAIKSAADVAQQQEQDACIEAGACTDYGMWLKWAAIVGLAWFAWEKMGVGDKVKSSIKGGS
jgi:hypothetical protein